MRSSTEPCSQGRGTREPPSRVVCRHRTGDLRIGRRLRRLADADSPQRRSGSLVDPAVEGAGRCPVHRPQRPGLCHSEPSPTGSPGGEREGRRRRWRPGLPGRQPTRRTRTERAARTARVSARAPRSRWSSLPREFSPRKVRRALGHVDPLEGVAMGTSSRSAWSRVPQSLGPGRSERDVFAGWQQQANHTRRSERNRNPTSGSGPRDRNVAGEQTVEGVRNSEDGTCRVRQARVERTLLPMSLKGRQNPKRGTGDRHSLPGNRLAGTGLGSAVRLAP